MEGDAVVVGLADAQPCATAPPSHLPALLYERLDEIGIDFTILYPSMALGYFEVTDEELSSVLCRAVNRYHAARCSRRTATAAPSARWSR